MRLLFLILASLALAQCATKDEDDRFQVGDSERAFVIIGVAEAPTNREAEYRLLWRQVEGGAFADYGGRTAFEAETNSGGTLRVRGIPGEFEMREIRPGVYALDSVFAIIRENRLNYVAEGLITGPDRPSFEVRPGEAVYLGIWQVDIEDVTAVARPWRITEDDLRAVLRETEDINGQVRIRQTTTIPVTCAPHQLNSRSRRQVC